MDAPPSPRLAPEDFREVATLLVDELRRPIQGLESSLVEMIDESPTPPAGSPVPDQRAALAEICRELRAMTDDFLQYVGVDLRESPASVEPMRLSQLMGLAIARLGGWNPRPAVACEVAGPDAEVLVEASSLLNVIDRLVENAVRYSPAEAPVVLKAEANEDSWSVEVEDQGSGIPPTDRTLMMEPFTRLHRDVKAGTTGAGLGLAVCNALVGKLGGTISIGSSQRGGTRVRVELPRG